MKRVLITLISLFLVATAAMAQAGTSETWTAQEATERASVSDVEITLRWKAQQEERAYGYLVYRAEARQGPFRRVSDRLVRVVEDDAAETSAYTWTDRNVVAGTTYFYYLDIVSIGGIKQRFSGVLSRTAEAKADPAQADQDASNASETPK